VNKENGHDNVFHRYNLRKVHVEIELQQQMIHLMKYIYFLFFNKSNLQANKAKVSAAASNQKLYDK